MLVHFFVFLSLSSSLRALFSVTQFICDYCAVCLAKSQLDFLRLSQSYLFLLWFKREHDLSRSSLCSFVYTFTIFCFCFYLEFKILRSPLAQFNVAQSKTKTCSGKNKTKKNAPIISFIYIKIGNHNVIMSCWHLGFTFFYFVP